MRDALTVDLDDPLLLSPLRWDAESWELLLIDQLKLPHSEEWLRFRTPEAVAEAIRKMIVRGAPAIGITAAYGVALAARQGAALGPAIALLRATRPTAKNRSGRSIGWSGASPKRAGTPGFQRRCSLRRAPSTARTWRCAWPSEGTAQSFCRRAWC